MSAATAIGTVFALSAVSAFRDGSAVRAIARVVAPRRAAAAELERQVAAVRRSTAHLGVLVPAHWRGSLAIEGTRWRGRGRDRWLTGFSVAAHDLDAPDGEPRLEILHELGDMPQVLVERHQAQAVVFEHDRRRIAVTATGAELSGLELIATRAIEPLLEDMIHRATTRLRS